MNAEFIGGAIFVITTIFAAGGIVWTTRKELVQTKLDVNRMGSKIRDLEKTVARYNHNHTSVLQAIVDNRDERFKIAGLLREDG